MAVRRGRSCGPASRAVQFDTVRYQSRLRIRPAGHSAAAAAAGHSWAHGKARWEPVPAPGSLLGALPLGSRRAALVQGWRAEARRILAGGDAPGDDRLIVVTGPVSADDPAAVLEYAERLAGPAREHRADLLVVMRASVTARQPGTGWKGLAADPGQDGGHDIGTGLRASRKMLLAIADAGLPAACALADEHLPQYLADTVSWAVIEIPAAGGRSGPELASALPMPAGFPGGDGGDRGRAVRACQAAAAPHYFMAAGPGGARGRVSSPGNPDCHLILRGGAEGPGHGPRDVASALGMLKRAGRPPRVIIDASGAAGGRDYRRQPAVAEAVAGQVRAGQEGIAGISLDSYLRAGRQYHGLTAPSYGTSVDGGCISLDQTLPVLESLASAVQVRRRAARAAA